MKLHIYVQLCFTNFAHVVAPSTSMNVSLHFVCTTSYCVWWIFPVRPHSKNFVYAASCVVLWLSFWSWDIAATATLTTGWTGCFPVISHIPSTQIRMPLPCEVKICIRFDEIIKWFHTFVDRLFFTWNEFLVILLCNKYFLNIGYIYNIGFMFFNAENVWKRELIKFNLGNIFNMLHYRFKSLWN